MNPERKEALLEDVARRSREILAERLDPVGDRPLTVDEIEELVEEASREAARWLEERLITEQTPPAANCAACPQCGQPARYKQTLHTQLHTIHGPQPVVARYYYGRPCGHGFCPADVGLGLERGRKATRRLRAWMARLAVQGECFAAVSPILAELRGLVTSESTVERTTVEVGLALAAATEAGAARAQTADPAEVAASEAATPTVPAGAEPSPTRLYLAMDGTMCPLRDAWRRDGSLGKLVCRYGEAKVGMAFTTGQKDGLDTGIVTRGCLGTLGDITAFTPRMVALGERKAHRKLREEQLTFFQGNRARMQYQTYLARGYMVGSGAIESQCKQLVQRRLHEGGMHWRERTAEAVLAIRACFHSTQPTDLRVYA